MARCDESKYQIGKSATPELENYLFGDWVARTSTFKPETEEELKKRHAKEVKELAERKANDEKRKLEEEARKVKKERNYVKSLVEGDYALGKIIAVMDDMGKLNPRMKTAKKAYNERLDEIIEVMGTLKKK